MIALITTQLLHVKGAEPRLCFFRKSVRSSARVQTEVPTTQVSKMKKPLTIISFIIAAISASCAPAYCQQQLSFDQMTRMVGGNEPYLSSLSVQYDTRGVQVNVGRPGFSAVAQYGFAPGTAGDSGDFGNDSSGSYNLANDDNTVSDYYGTTANQMPYSAGGLPQTTTAVQSLEGGYGNRFGKTSIPSAKFKYGFSNSPATPYRGVSGNRMMRGSNLPPVSTASLDLDIVDKGPNFGEFQRTRYTPSAEGLRAIRAAQARGTVPRNYDFGR